MTNTTNQLDINKRIEALKLLAQASKLLAEDAVEKSKTQYFREVAADPYSGDKEYYLDTDKETFTLDEVKAMTTEYITKNDYSWTAKKQFTRKEAVNVYCETIRAFIEATNKDGK